MRRALKFIVAAGMVFVAVQMVFAEGGRNAPWGLCKKDPSCLAATVVKPFWGSLGVETGKPVHVRVKHWLEGKGGEKDRHEEGELWEHLFRWSIITVVKDWF